MPTDLIAVAFALWIVAALLGLVGRTPAICRWLLGAGSLCGVAAALACLPAASATLTLPIALADQPVTLRFDPGALWLMGFGLFCAALACFAGPPMRRGARPWIVGCASSLIGALGVFGVQDAMSFLVAWELMSLGGALMIVGERIGNSAGRSAMFMLALLEVGSIALLLALLLYSAGGSTAFASFATTAAGWSPAACVVVALLVLVGFGAKLGLLPFYEWFAGAYANASGTTGVVMSGVMLNAAFFGLSRAYVEWLAPQATGVAMFAVGIVTVAVGVATAVLAALYAFQQDDWRTLLAFSSAENAAVAVTMLGASLLFRNEALRDLAGLAWTVALVHLAAHVLAKSALFLTADSVFLASESYAIAQRGWLRQRGVALGIGALFATMSLSAIPPQSGFVSEWYTFQTVFQGFHLETFSGRVTLALAGAGLALTAAIALATFVKAFGLGLLGAGDGAPRHRAPRRGAAVGLLGVGVLALAVGMPLWLGALRGAVITLFGADSVAQMVDGWILVPLTAKFAFISPSMLVIAMPLLSIVPVLLYFAFRRGPIRREPVWYGGTTERAQAVATTSLSFASALRTFYSFIYRPVMRTTRHHEGSEYFVRRVVVSEAVAPVFTPTIFTPVSRFVQGLAGRLRAMQSGDLNFYVALIGALWVLILGLSLV